AVEYLRRQLAHSAEEAVVAGAGRQRTVIVLQFVAVARLDKAHGDRLAQARTQHVGILLEIVEPKRGHGRLPSRRKLAGAPHAEAAPALAAIKPARTAFRFRGRYRSTTGRRHAGPGRSSGTVPGASGSAAARCGTSRRDWPKRPQHDD